MCVAGLDPATLDELWRNLSERGPASAQCAGMELAMTRRDDVMQAVQGGGRAKGFKVRRPAARSASNVERRLWCHARTCTPARLHACEPAGRR